MGQINSCDFPTIGTLAEKRKLLTLGLLMYVDCPVERRTAVRYEAHLPVIFSWNDGTEHREGGFTGNVARDGALILSRRCPPIGTEIRMEMLLPSPDQSKETIEISGMGRVTRVCGNREAAAFGVHGAFHDEALILRT